MRPAPDPAAPGGSGAMGAPAWIAADWGTSRLRVWAMGAGAEPLAAAASDRGMGTLARSEFEPALLELVAPWLAPDRRTPVLACGMVGARQGWVEAPYRRVPCAPVAAPPVPAPVTDPRLTVHVVPGLMQPAPADVMRGEETQIAGFLAARPGFDGVLCLPGTHTKWAQVSAGEVVSFRTAMTGELFATLAAHSVLRHTLEAGGRATWDAAAFAASVTDTLARPEGLATRLFAIRAEALLAGLAPGAARARLSGLLIGAELAATRAYWLGQPVAIIGAPAIAEPYAAALALQGNPPESADGAAMTRAGLALARAALQEIAR